jgi:mycothiol synthase
VPGDAEAILAVGVARDVADVGEPDWSIEAVRDELAGASDAVVATDGDGAVVGFALLTGIDARVAVHPDACGRGIGTALREWVEERATGDVLRQETMGSNDAANALLEAAGYERTDHFWRMARELDGSEQAPDWPAGVAVRPFERGRDERAAFELVSEAMRDVPGSTERTFEEWTARALGERLSPELSLVASDADGAMAGLALCERWDERDGYVDYLAVATRWQGHGLGRALLRGALAGFASAGLRRGILWVHGDNESATALYRGAGMEAAFTSDRYVKRLR